MTIYTRLDRIFYTNGKVTSHVMANAVGETATIVRKKRRAVRPVWDKNRNRFPMEEGWGFNEISMVPYNEASNIKKLGLDDIMTVRPTNTSFNKQEWLSAMDRATDESWDPSKFNLVFHSSGYDSRIISHFIRKAYERRPGKILFVCMEPEGEPFKKIMNYQGWDETQWAIYDMFADPFKLWFDFYTSWEGLNGPRLMPHNGFDVCIKYLQILEKVPKDLSNVVLWHGVDMNELMLQQEPLDTIVYQMYYQLHPTAR